MKVAVVSERSAVRWKLEREIGGGGATFAEDESARSKKAEQREWRDVFIWRD